MLDALQRQIRSVSARSVLLSQAVAERLGLNPTDLEFMDLLNLNGPLTAKRLAELSGLTTGGVTFVVDRLERAGFVRRRPNPEDRRSVLIEPVEEAIGSEIGPLYASIVRAMGEVYARYSDEELAVILDFMVRCDAVTQAEIDGLRAAPPARRGRV
jgi:DNA-binding MarR family transcriptional regulator